MGILFVSHSHPDFSKGGAELAAWRLFESVRGQKGYESSGFLAAAPHPDDVFMNGCEVKGLTEDQWLIRPSMNPIVHSASINLSADGMLFAAIREKDFKLIHIHHYLHVGIDLIYALKRWFPNAKFIMTLHDYWAPCVYEGRLLRSSGLLCEGGSPKECDICLGQGYRGELAIRSIRLAQMFAMIDQFISPSFFLKKQYLAWGVDNNLISVVENLPIYNHHPPVANTGTFEGINTGVLVVSYFGQVNPWKGLDVILRALQIALDHGSKIELRVHGIDQQDFETSSMTQSPFLKTCAELMSKLDEQSVRVMGRYDSSEINALMESTDVMVMGSIWYENSPMVIQEAFLHKVPVIAPNLGGMAEKVKDHKSGLLYKVCDEYSLANCLNLISVDRDLLRHLREGAINSSNRLLKFMNNHQLIYQSLTS